MSKHGFSEVNLPNHDLVYPVHVAVKLGDLKMLRRLVSAGATVHQKTSKGLLPMDFVTAYCGPEQQMKQIIEYLKHPTETISMATFVRSSRMRDL